MVAGFAEIAVTKLMLQRWTCSATMILFLNSSRAAGLARGPAEKRFLLGEPRGALVEGDPLCSLGVPILDSAELEVVRNCPILGSEEHARL